MFDKCRIRAQLAEPYDVKVGTVLQKNNTADPPPSPKRGGEGCGLQPQGISKKEMPFAFSLDIYSSALYVTR